MYKIKATIVGQSPLRHNKYNEQKGNSGMSSKKSTQAYKDQAMERAYYDDEGGFYVPKHALKKVICEGGKKVKIGRGAASTIIKAIFILQGDKFYIGTHKHELYTEAVRIPPKTGARVMQYWVMNQEWSCTFEALILDDVIPAEAIKQSIQFGGLYNGLLDGRPEFGRFELTEFEVVE